jgi:hypothetical protein
MMLRFGSAAESPLELLAELGASPVPDSFRLTNVVDFVRYIVRRQDVEASNIYEDMMLRVVKLEVRLTAMAVYEIYSTALSPL